MITKKLKTNNNKLYKYEEQTQRLYISLKMCLRSYSKYGNYTKASNAGGITLRTLKDCLIKYPKFKKKWEEAHDNYMDSLESIALKRAKAGSDTLLKFLMTAGRPEKFGRIQQTFVQNNLNVHETIKEVSTLGKQIKQSLKDQQIQNIRNKIPTVLELNNIEGEINEN